MPIIIAITYWTKYAKISKLKITNISLNCIMRSHKVTKKLPITQVLCVIILFLETITSLFPKNICTYIHLVPVQLFLILDYNFIINIFNTSNWMNDNKWIFKWNKCSINDYLIMLLYYPFGKHINQKKNKTFKLKLL